MTSIHKIKSLAKWAWSRSFTAASFTVVVLLLAWSAVGSSSFAQTAEGFDHSTTLFPLTGLHEQVRCEACHIKGIFKGTPRDCGGCHVENNPRGAKAKSVNHIQSSNNCEECHSVTSFTGAHFNHISVQPGTCGACHDGRRATGRTPDHFPTASSCDRCHGTSSFKNLQWFDHRELNGDLASCASCHNGTKAKGKPANHLPRSADAQCGACHVASTQNGFTSFAGGQMDHTGMTTGCADCHGPNITGASFIGVTNIIAMPPTSPAGPRAHIPSSTTCENCHLQDTPMGLMAANAVNGVPGSDFGKNPQQAKLRIHDGITSGCSNCHETNFTWLGMASYPPTPSTFVAKAQYTGFHSRPTAAGGQFAVADANHPSTGDCSECHAGTTYFSGEVKPANHIPYAASANCNACHTSSDYAAMPTLANIHKYAANPKGNCLQCHGNATLNGGQPASYYAIPEANFSIKALPDNHVPYTAGQECQVCHTSIAVPVVDGATFANSKMVHAATNSACDVCHGAAVTNTTFAGVTKIVVLPPTSPAGVSSHMPLGSVTKCDACHVLTAPATAMAGVAASTTPGSTGFYPGSVTSKPTSTQVHAGITANNCNQCHADGMVWMSVTGPYPMTPATLTQGTTAYKGFQTLPKATGSATNIADPSHPPASDGDCSKCHTSTDAFDLPMPAKHMPYKAGTACATCHTTTNWATMPALTPIHANMVTGATCASCHAKAVAGTFLSSAAFVADGANHLPFSGDCAACHIGAAASIKALPVVNGAKFSGSGMAHAATTASCDTCHGANVKANDFQGVSAIIVLPKTSPAGTTSHIPTTAPCEQCHALTTLAAQVPGVATKTVPGTGFASPAAKTAQIHAGISGNCAQCHDTGMNWMGMDTYYPMTPKTKSSVAGTKYNGFHSRPTASGGSHAIADAAHPATGECGDCHSSFDAWSGVDTPVNHIPFAATAQCTSCHTSTNYAVLPTVTNIHKYAQSTTGNCLQCHGNAQLNSGKPASYYAIAKNNFSIKALPDNHLPYTAGKECMACHNNITTPVTDGASFANSNMAHSATNSSCATCHGESVTGTTFAGVTSIVVLPKMSPMGASSHIPTTAACDQCHKLTAVPALVPGVATKVAGTGTTLFGTGSGLLPTSANIHSGLTSGCATCHEANYTWMGMSAYPVNANTIQADLAFQYRGFQTRPTSAGGPNSVRDPAHGGSAATGDCQTCHSEALGFVYFSASAVVPTNHIPYAAGTACSACHTAGDYSTQPSLTNIHRYAQSTTGNCLQCHGNATLNSGKPASYYALPANNFSIKALPDNHLPYTAGKECMACHNNITTPVTDGASFANSNMAHSATSSSCATCHGASVTGTTFAGVTSIVVLPQTTPMGVNSHIPTTAACDQCHKLTGVPVLVPGVATKTAGTGATLFGTGAAVLPTSANIHAGMTGGCASCHEANYTWMGMSAYPVNANTIQADLAFQYRGFQTRPTAAGGANSVMDSKHTGSAATNSCETCHSEAMGFTYFSGMVTPSNHIPYASNVACSACHTSADYSVQPTLTNIHKYAQSTTGNCLQCHGNATLNGGKPASYYAIPSANFSIKALPDNHVPYTAGQECQVCHTSIAVPVTNGATFANSKMVHAATNSACDVCHGATVTNTTFAGVTKIVVLPPTSPAGVNSHMPLGSVTKCDACHVLTAPATAMAGVAASTTPGTTGFYPGSVTSKPTSAQVHAGITTTNCNQCHADGMVWMSVTGPYPMTPSTLTVGTTAYKGFQTLPKATGSATNIADAYHPAASAGDCSKCHTSTDAFDLPMPAKHMPYKAGTACATCHTTTNWSTMPALTPIHANTVTGATCASCHAKAVAGTFLSSAAFVADGANHIPFDSTADCAACHVGTGSSITALPVVNGAKFSGSAIAHTAASSVACATCHGSTVTNTTFQGITKIVVMPPSTTAGASSHIPSTAACDACHKGETPTGLVPGNATSTTVPGTGFGTVTVLGTNIHANTGVSTCNNCHNTGMVWLGVGKYTRTPTTKSADPATKYYGFNSRPTSAGSTYAIADPAHAVGSLATDDCSICHQSTAYFSGATPPTGHIPLTYGTSACTVCHINGSDYSIQGLATTPVLHTGMTLATNCKACHVDGAGAAPFVSCDTQATCTTPLTKTYRPKQMPLSGSAATPNVLTHLYVGTANCGDACHKTFSKFSDGTRKMYKDAPSHVQAYNGLKAAGVAEPCRACHKSSLWYGITKNSASNRTPNGFVAKNHESGDCIKCHMGEVPNVTPATHPYDWFGENGNNTHASRVRPVLRAAVVGARPQLGVPGLTENEASQTGGAAFSHRGVLPGNCASCHNGQMAKGLPAKHLVTHSSCDACHRNTAWKPAEFSHQGVPQGQCQSCHNGQNGPGKLAGHFVTSRSCDACHKVVAWLPVIYSHTSPAFQVQPDKTTCLSCHITNGEIIPRQMRGGTRPRPQ